MLKLRSPAALLVPLAAAGTLLFSFTASADSHRDRSRADRQHERHHDHDRRRDDDRRYHRDERGRDYRSHRYHNHDRYDRRFHRDNRRYYWHDGHYWRHSYVPSYYSGRYYSYHPRDSRGRLIITIPF